MKKWTIFFANGSNVDIEADRWSHTKDSYYFWIDGNKHEINPTAIAVFSRKTIAGIWEKRKEKQTVKMTVVRVTPEPDPEHLVSWLSKFCRHIDMGDKPYTDEEALKFFKEKMNRQFGWEFKD